MRNCALSLFPCYRIMKKYNWKTDFIADMICGLTVGIMQLPQGMYHLVARVVKVIIVTLWHWFCELKYS